MTKDILTFSNEYDVGCNSYRMSCISKSSRMKASRNLRDSNTLSSSAIGTSSRKLDDSILETSGLLVDNWFHHVKIIRICTHSDWMRRFTLYSVRIRICGPEKLQIQTPFAFCVHDQNLRRLVLMEAVVQKCSVKKVFLETLQNSQENTCARVSFLIKLQTWGPYRINGLVSIW